jgi:3',5'-cyclic AMP phosphodiesterase CpdA
MKKIVHLSDLHVGFRNMIDRWTDLVQVLITQLTPPSDYVILITGDLVDKPDDHAPYQKTHDILEKLKAVGFTVLVVPGNHDYNGGFLLDKNFVPRFKDVFFGDAQLQYPKVDIVDDTAFIGLDSLAEELHWYDRLFADGELGKAQLQRLDDRLGDSTVRACEHRVIYMHHHPFALVPFSQLKDARRLRRVIQKHNNVDALLFGHHHLGRSRRNKWNILRCYDGGTATGMLPGRVYHRMFDLSQEPDQDFVGVLCDFDNQAEGINEP